MKKKYTPEIIDFLRHHVNGRSVKELTLLVNAHFGLSFTERQIASAKHIHGLSKGSHHWTKEELSFMKKHAGETLSRLTVLVNSTFGTTFTIHQVSSCRIYYKYKTKVCKNYKKEAPLNAEVTGRGGHLYIKVSMDGPCKQRWKEKHRLVWEQANGKIPAGMNIIFLDNNPHNCSLENLAMVSLAEKIRLEQFKLRSDNREVTLAGIAIVKHFMAVHSRLKGMLGPEARFIFRSSRRRLRARKKEMELI